MTEAVAIPSSKTTKSAGSGIKKFTGYQTPDGKTHASQVAAVQHVTDQKIKAALAESFSAAAIEDQMARDDRGYPTLSANEVQTFLFDNRVAILAALNQSVRTRRVGGGRKKVATETSTA